MTETKKSILTCEVSEHQLVKDGVRDFCIVKMRLFDGVDHYAESTAIHAEYVMTSRFPDQLLEAVIISLKKKFLANFPDTYEIDDKVEISDIRTKVKQIWKPGS